MCLIVLLTGFDGAVHPGPRIAQRVFYSTTGLHKPDTAGKVLCV